MKKSDRERRTDASTCKMMPEDFVPGPYEVLIGRGRRCTMHWGNQRFRAMIDSELPAYTAAQDCKRQKSVIIGRVLADIQHHSPHAGFVKKDVATGRWLSLTDAASRVTIAQAFRDALVGTYRSSKHSKQVKRRVEKRERQPAKSVSKTAASMAQPEAAMPELVMPTCDSPIPPEFADEDFNDSFTFAASFVADVVVEDNQEEQQQQKTRSEFDALFDAFASSEVNLEDNPFEPVPLATPDVEPELEEIEPLPFFPEYQSYTVPAMPSISSLKRKGIATDQHAFGRSVPSRNVSAAMTA